MFKVDNSECSISITPENVRFSDIFRGYRKGRLPENGLNYKGFRF